MDVSCRDVVIIDAYRSLDAASQLPIGKVSMERAYQVCLNITVPLFSVTLTLRHSRASPQRDTHTYEVQSCSRQALAYKWSESSHSSER